jgi:methylated-DNA-[protein]-cysteine S-methyltransferase
MQNVCFYEYPLGLIGIAEENGAVSRVFFSREKKPREADPAPTPILQKAAAQLAEYFARKRTCFDLPLSLHGTDFQISVWNALRTIPCGETRSYKDIAAQIGNPKASRAVGMANHHNPIAVIIPCHRVIGQNGGLTGYAGGLESKKYLLDLEKRPA